MVSVAYVASGWRGLPARWIGSVPSGVVSVGSGVDSVTFVPSVASGVLVCLCAPMLSGMAPVAFSGAFAASVVSGVAFCGLWHLWPLASVTAVASGVERKGETRKARIERHPDSHSQESSLGALRAASGKPADSRSTTR